MTLTSVLMENSTLSEMVSTHPLKDQVRTGIDGLVLSDFLYPVHQAAFMLGLNAQVALFNDDNAPAINYARRTARKINRRLALAIPSRLELLGRVPSRLVGSDGQRMSKSNGNALPLSASHSRVRAFARALGEYFISTGDSSMIAGYDALFPGVGRIVDSYSGDGRRNELADAMWEGLAAFRQERESANANETIVDGLVDDETRGLERIRDTLDSIGL
jgi:tyrosyl-tRNA synthetase